MVRRAGSESDRLTLSGFPRDLKRALIYGAQRERLSLEKFVIATLRQALAREIEIIERMDQELSSTH